MNATQWREHGYKTIFRDEIYLVRPLSGVVIHTPVDNGKWMRHDNVNETPWVKESQGMDGLTPAMVQDFHRTLKACYCDHGVDICDFCAGIRRA